MQHSTNYYIDSIKESLYHKVNESSSNIDEIKLDKSLMIS